MNQNSFEYLDNKITSILAKWTVQDYFRKLEIIDSKEVKKLRNKVVKVKPFDNKIYLNHKFKFSIPTESDLDREVEFGADRWKDRDILIES